MKLSSACAEIMTVSLLLTIPPESLAAVLATKTSHRSLMDRQSVEGQKVT